MEEYKISTLSEYISEIEVLKKHYPCGVWGNPISNHFLYLGLPNSTFKLLPSLFRKQEDEVDGKKIVNNKYRAWADEISILRAFILEASGILSVPTNQLCQWAVYAQHYGVPTRFWIGHIIRWSHFTFAVTTKSMKWTVQSGFFTE